MQGSVKESKTEIMFFFLVAKKDIRKLSKSYKKKHLYMNLVRDMNPRDMLFKVFVRRFLKLVTRSFI